MSKYTLEEKRLQLIRRQLYGKQDSQTKLSNKHKPLIQSKDEYKFEAVKQDINISTLSPEIGSNAIFLKKDLFKIAYISLGAIGLQILLFWSLSMKLVHF